MDRGGGVAPPRSLHTKKATRHKVVEVFRHSNLGEVGEASSNGGSESVRYSRFYYSPPRTVLRTSAVISGNLSNSLAAI